MDDPEKGDTVTPCMDVYKGKNQYDGIPYKLNLIVLVREDLKNKGII